jgi:hypothetical protein
VPASQHIKERNPDYDIISVVKKEAEAGQEKNPSGNLGIPGFFHYVLWVISNFVDGERAGIYRMGNYSRGPEGTSSYLQS